MTFGDRTSEFAAVAQALRASTHVQASAARNRQSAARQKQSFNKAASEIGRATHECAEKLKELTKLSKSTAIFDDQSSSRIEELTNIVKQDIQGIRSRIEALQHIVDAQQGRQSDQSTKHSGTIITTLNTSLKDTTDQFRKALEIRTESLKAQQEKRDRLGAGRRAMSSALMYQVFNPDLEGSATSDDQNGDGEISIALPLVQTREQFLEQRSQSIRMVETTITQLKTVFTELSTIAAQQHELIERIDENILEAQTHVDTGYKEIVKYLPKVTANRWLYLKIFAVLLVFMILFIVFFV